jgi:GntR family negative regulator for fad regulon and positive regulator of fabA
VLHSYKWLVVLPEVFPVNLPVEPIRVQSLKEALISRLEGLILSGELKIGERLPSERDFAARLNVSRPVLHEALVDLAAKGLVEIVSRRGVFISDFRTRGSVAMLSSLLSYHNGALAPEMAQSLMDMRLVVEAETARLAALNRVADHLAQFDALLAREASADMSDPLALTELDFSFHLLVAIASGNLVYPLIINSFKPVYTHLTGEFFKQVNPAVIGEVFGFHRSLAAAMRAMDSTTAVSVMQAMLKHGEQHLKGGA